MILRIAKISALFLGFCLVAGVSAYMTLTLIIKSEDTVIVPELIGKDVVSALERLTELELNAKVKGSEYSTEFPKNHVVFQDPQPGSEIKKDRDVRIIISKGPKTVLIPNLVSLPVSQAEMILEENGLSPGQLSRTYSKAFEKDHVIAQLPSSGIRTERGSTVDLLLSLGQRPEAYLMPDLKGLTLDEFLLKIENTKLSVGEIRPRFQSEAPRDVIVSQDPPAGYRVVEGNPVQVAVNRTEPGNGAEHFHPSTSGTLLQHRVGSGFLKKRIRVKMETRETSSDLFDDYIKAGEEIWVLVPTGRDATVFVFEDDKLVKTQMYKAW
jgi:eukaryotic-like serine/threonine-protein kinase